MENIIFLYHTLYFLPRFDRWTSTSRNILEDILCI